ncbi:uncharacterized protein LOC113295053 [Papaver somniferum]|uniref:uncharacterized protein LOC113295053 n=1 Tax=Papaver somniferum TaxID=3469 RepID=UPI000E6F9B22|nr:uncharacterized protein LOC113295053 [Papaver somniferum]
MDVLSSEKNSMKIPSVELPDDLLEESLNPWKFSLIGRLDLQQIKFLDASRWEVLNQVLQVRKWISNFRPATQKTSKAMVWVRFPGLSLEFWSEKVLFTICKEIGTPIKIDNATTNCEKGYYANVLVEVDFAHHIPSKVWIGTKYGGFFQDVLIPDCPKFCTSCKIVGHLNSECRFEKNKHQTGKSSEASPKIIQRREKPTPFPFDICEPSLAADVVVDTIKVTVPSSKEGGDDISQQSKFSVLENVENEISYEVELVKTPKILEAVEEININNSNIKFVNGTNGTVVDVPIQVTSWSKVVEKEMVTSTSASSSAAKSPGAYPKVNSQVPLNNKYNFRKNPGKGGTRNPPPKQ